MKRVFPSRSGHPSEWARPVNGGTPLALGGGESPQNSPKLGQPDQMSASNSPDQPQSTPHRVHCCRLSVIKSYFGVICGFGLFWAVGACFGFFSTG